MKALIIMREKDCSWLRQVSPDSHPGLFEVCNKPLLEYLVDFAILQGCSEVRLALNEPGADVERYFGAGSRWGIGMTYCSFKDDDRMEQILEKNSGYSAESSLLIMDGLFFIHYDKAQQVDGWKEISVHGRSVNCSTGSVLYAPDRDSLKNISSALTEVDFSLSPLESLDDIFQISMQILAAEQEHYVLPGYGVEKGVILGRNVEVRRDVTINEPVIIGNNVRILGGSVIGPFSVIGNNVIVDKGTEVKESVVHRESYLGRNLTFNRKIIRGKRIFSFGEAEAMVVEDDFLLSSVHSNLSLPNVRLMLNSISALVLVVALFIPYFLLAGLRKAQGDWKQQELTCLRNSRMETLKVKKTANNPASLAGKLFSLLFLERYPLLPMVVIGRLKLVGNRLLEDTRDNREIVADFQEYLPGVFGYSEAEDVDIDSQEAVIAERFYAANSNVIRDSKMLLRILCSRALV